MSRRRFWNLVVLVPLLGMLEAGCDDAAPGPVDTTPVSGVRVIEDASLCRPGQVGRAPLRRLSRNEYNNMVRDLLGDTKRPADYFVPEQKIAGFNSNSDAPVNALIVRQYLEAAEEQAAAAVAPDMLTTMVPCASNAPDDACARTFIADFAGRAFRGGLDEAQSAELFTLFQDVRSQFDFAGGIEAVITAVLTSPRFLFVLEFGAADARGMVVPLSPHEVATRLALYLWRSLPDATLAQVAARGQLRTPDEIEVQALRMLADPKAADGAEAFADQWLQIENLDTLTKDPATAPNWFAQLAKDLHRESLTTYRELVLTQGDGGGLTELLTSPYAYINSNAATYVYHLDPDAAGLTSDTFLRTNLNADPDTTLRAGIFTSGGVLATHGHRSLPSPTLRGKMVSTQLLCTSIPAPPADPDIGTAPDSAPPAETIREYYELHHIDKKPSCYGCHQHMDLIGFGFDDFDTTGTLYAGLLDNGKPIDDSGTFVEINPYRPPEIEGPFQGPVDMMTKLAASTQVRECMAVQQFRYAFGHAEGRADACSLQAIYRDFVTSGFNLKSLVTAVVRSDGFRTRTVNVAGGACQ